MLSIRRFFTNKTRLDRICNDLADELWEQVDMTKFSDRTCHAGLNDSTVATTLMLQELSFHFADHIMAQLVRNRLTKSEGVRID